MINPGDFRRGLQARYDRYMSGEALTLGVGADMSQFMGSLEERNAKIAAFAHKFPKKTQDLAGRVAHELIYLEASKANHVIGSRNFFGHEDVLSKLEDIDAKAAYFSGVGRNAVAVTIAGGDGMRSLLTNRERALDILQVVEFDLMIIDPDFGMGDFRTDRRPTPVASISFVDPSNRQIGDSWLRLRNGATQ